jgi:hypothetical protein
MKSETKTAPFLPCFCLVPRAEARVWSKLPFGPSLDLVCSFGLQVQPLGVERKVQD